MNKEEDKHYFFLNFTTKQIILLCILIHVLLYTEFKEHCQQEKLIEITYYQRYQER
ncbi:hypothetical protein A1OE_386 [Candidatus Endolissoclinum faulkneri L2]|uniref:Uncharacterized protein n=1 Tax=Candidatus Endolissoclinum faulkneri L2 TaxID=1193729 RepID=K7ZCH4_9PROT|nr:hypothetical protein A1OE_386 [Candidatus Endolissoclinum faulkneri L2]